MPEPSAYLQINRRMLYRLINEHRLVTIDSGNHRIAPPQALVQILEAV